MVRAVHLALVGIRRAEQPHRLEQLAQGPAALVRLQLGERELAHPQQARWRWGRWLRRPRWWCRRLWHAVSPAFADVWLIGLLPFLALRQFQPMYLAEHRHAGELGALEFSSNLRCR